MFIDDFIWLPEILDKLEWKHHLSPDEVEEVFLISHVSDFTKKGRSKARMCTQQWVKQKVDNI